MTWRRPRVIGLVATLALMGGCDKPTNGRICADDGDCAEPNDDDSGGSISGCGEETTTVLTDLSAVPSGFQHSAADIVASIEGSYSGKLTWRPNDGPINVAHAETNSPLTLTVEHDGGEVRLIEVELSGQFPDGNEGGTPCSNRIEVDTAISFATEDGLFAETWDASVTQDSVEDDFSGGGAASLYRPIDFLAHEGTLVQEDFTFEGAQLEDVIVTAGFGDGEVTGSLLMEVRSAGDDGGWIGAGDVATFSATATSE